MIRIVTIIIIAGIIVSIVAGFFLILPSNRFSIDSSHMSTTTQSITPKPEIDPVPVIPSNHIPMPQSIKGIYFTNWAAGTPSFRKSLFNLFDGTILNTVVIDVKDYSGRIGFEVSDPDLIKMGSVQKRIPDIKELITSLHAKGVYVIGRVAVFQDPFVVKVKPQWAVHDVRTGVLWKDSGGAYWADPTNRDFWKYIVAIARESYANGFDEINFDYVRFPSDGAISSSVYSALPKTLVIYKPLPVVADAKISTGLSTTSTKIATSTKSATSTKIIATSTKIYVSGKSQVIRDFFKYLHDELASSTSPTINIPISVDIFGQVTSDTGDMGIGQILEDAMPYVDFIDPMVYPSHYINGFLGYDKPAKYPYEIVKYEMDQAVARSKAASSSPLLMRPWLQAFDLGAIYTPEMVRAQISATYDAGLTSWILWNAGSVYTKSTFLTDPKMTPVVSKLSTASSTRP
ncbi:MAG: putative glycoside hydrolase [Candidatus Taylorbacteria bacterium]